MVAAIKFGPIVFFLICLLNPLSAQEVVFVDISYPDTLESDGSKLRPFRSIQDAVDSAPVGSDIYIHEGVYREEVEIDVEGITIQAFQGGDVEINGTEPLLDWKLVSEGVYYTIMDWDITSFDYSNQIFLDGRMMELARWPKENTEDPINHPNRANIESASNNENYLIVSDNELPTPSLWLGAKININPSNPSYRTDGQGWTGEVYKVAGQALYTDPDLPVDGGPYSVGRGSLYYLFDPRPEQVYAAGGPEVLLDHGEWWKSGDTLFLKTFDGLAPASHLDAPNLIEAKKRIFAFKPGTTDAMRFITIKDVSLFAATITTENNFNYRTIVSSSQSVTINGITGKYIMHTHDLSGNFQHQWSTNSGIILQGTGHVLKNSQFTHSAGSAASLMGRNHKVLNNRFIRCNYQGTEPGIINFGTFGSVSEDMEVGNNTFLHSPHNAISLGFLVNTDKNQPGLSRIHHNYFYNMMTQYFDLGVIEQAGNYGGGLRIDHNIIHNDSTADFGMAKAGIYMDFGDTGRNNEALYFIDNNIIYNIEYGILLAHLNGTKIYNNTVYAAETNAGRIGITANRMEEDGRGVEIVNNLYSGIDGGYGAADFQANYVPDSLQWTTLVEDVTQGNFHLTNNADQLVDKGDSVPEFMMPSDRKPDIGALEKGDESSFVAGAELRPVQYAFGGIPHRIEDSIAYAEFDEGGFGISYLDATREDSTTRFRSTSVDIYQSADLDTVLLVDADSGEWLEYTVDVAFSGIYELQTNLKSEDRGRILFLDRLDTVLAIELDGSGEWEKYVVPEVKLSRGKRVFRVLFEAENVSGDYFWFEAVSLTPRYQLHTSANGGHIEIRSDQLFFDEGDSVMLIARPESGNVFSQWTGDISGRRDTIWVYFNNHIEAIAHFATVPQSPFGGEPWPIPGVIQSEDYDEGGNNVAYFDNSPGNSGQSMHRDDSVDIQNGGECGSPIIAWIGRDEWREYTIDVKEPGNYNIDLSLAADIGFGGEFKIEFETGELSTGIVEVEPSGGWSTCRLVTIRNIELDTGIQIMRVTPLSGGHNHDYMRFYRAEEQTGFQIELDADAGGRVSLEPQKDFYALDEEVRVIAEPDPGFELLNWRGNLVGTDTSAIVVVNGNMIIKAAFEPISYRFRTRAEPSGSGSILIDPVRAYFYFNDTVSVRADPVEGWEFSHWSGSLISSDSSDRIIVQAPVDITGHFRKEEEPVDTVVTQLQSGAIQIYPNPFEQSITLSGIELGSHLTVSDMKGTIIKSQPVSTKIIQINTIDWSPGLYVLEIQHTTKNHRYKLMKW